MKCLWVRAALGLAVLVATVGLSGTPAFAHNALSSSAPKDKAVLDQVPAMVTLKFLARLSPLGTKVTVVGPDGTSAAAGPARFDGPTVMVPLRATTAGLYTASYEVASPDGHPVTGKVTFTLTERAAPSPLPAAPATSAPAATSEPAPVPSLRTAASDAAGGTPWWPWVLGAAALAGVAALIVVRRRRAP